MSARAVLVCYRCTQTGPITAEFTYWDTADQARLAESELPPCGPFCVGVHSVASLDLPPDRRRTAGRALRPSQKADR